MIPPRPTMTPEDVRHLREFFDSPAGAAVFDQINAGCEFRPLTERRGENFWRDSSGTPLPFPDDVEAANAVPPDFSRTFRPVYLARPMSRWPLIITIAVCFSACASALAWAVFDVIRIHA